MSTLHDTTELAGTALNVEQLLPDVAFTDAETGERWRPSQLRQRAALVLCFLHADCEACDRLLKALADKEDDLRWADARVRVVLPEPAPAPFPVLLDPDEEARARMLGDDAVIPTLLVADRYTAVIGAYQAPDHDFPDPDEVIAGLVVLACECE